MKKYITVPYIIKAKRLQKKLADPCLKGDFSYSVSLCDNEEAEAKATAKSEGSFSVKLIDIAKLMLAFSALCSLIALIFNLADED